MEVTNVIINGQQVEFTLPPKNIGGNIMLPLRELFELFGFQVNWDKHTKSITILKKDKTIILKDAELIATVNKNQYPKVPLNWLTELLCINRNFSIWAGLHIKYSRKKTLIHNK